MRARFPRVAGALLAAAALTTVPALTLVSTDQPAAAVGTIVFDGSPGTGAPPGTLGGYTMTKFAPDGRPFHTDVTTVPSPLSGPGSGTVTFNEPLSHRGVPGNGWSNWSNGYTSDVYCTDCSDSPNANTVTLTMPAHTVAFYFYAQSDDFGPFQLTATTDNGTTSGPITVDNEDPCGTGQCAKYFGFYTTDPSNPVVSVTISVAGTVDAPDPGLGIGEFGIAGLAPPPPPPTAAPASIVVAPKFTG